MKYVNAALLAAATLFATTALAEQTSAPGRVVAQPNPPVIVVSRPNLRFVGGITLRQVPGGPAVQQVHRNNRFLACYRVTNGGPVASGPFQVWGTPMGSWAPTQAHPGLASGAWHDRCLIYPAVTLPPGNYPLQIKADASNVVVESNEADNIVQRMVAVVP